ncbi:hypothetical protein [Escherichia coli]|uniref:hypothetical protein n=1 Tax=Escherichia coli TaxID=562 RepID=UPI0019111A80|nr:hypothetical protein [Escherichia coli]
MTVIQLPCRVRENRQNEAPRAAKAGVYFAALQGLQVDFVSVSFQTTPRLPTSFKERENPGGKHDHNERITCAQSSQAVVQHRYIHLSLHHRKSYLKVVAQTCQRS